MASINFYLDKLDKKNLSPIHLRINCDGNRVKVATGEKVDPNEFDKTNQTVSNVVEGHLAINYYLNYLKTRAEELFNNSYKKTYTNQEIKDILHKHIEAYKEDNTVNMVKEQLPIYGQSFTFIDFFAGAGGFSEGFIQAEHNNKFFDFLLGSDINENCELTHIVRYNHQLGLDAEFIKQDITEPDFIDNLMSKLKGKTIDVICGGPPCQSFSLAGKRKKYDKKDDLFSYYLEVIKLLKPKYFVMENVKGILTKEDGKVKEDILHRINSIIDNSKLSDLTKILKKNSNQTDPSNQFLMECYCKRLEFERYVGKDLQSEQAKYLQFISNRLNKLIPLVFDYKISKTDSRLNTIRRLLIGLKKSYVLDDIRKQLINWKADSNLASDDNYSETIDIAIGAIHKEKIIENVIKNLRDIKPSKKHKNEFEDIIKGVEILNLSLDECFGELLKKQSLAHELRNLNDAIDSLRLYNINDHFLANSADYGVPQVRERVLFIGCRKDQKLIENIPATVSPENRVTIFEALHDLDFIDNNEDIRHYQKVDIRKQYNGTSKEMKSLIKPRSIDGVPTKKGETYADWSKLGRLNGRYPMTKAFYVRNNEALLLGEKDFNELNNHRTSKQNDDVVKRLQIILEEGGYKKAQKRLEKEGLASQKRNYNMLKPEAQSSTIMTIPDDYIHYRSPRALTVREMARLQSFDDSFVFQGKRSTGGNNRKTEVPQYTLVGNAVPPLMARAVATEILKNIK